MIDPDDPFPIPTSSWQPPPPAKVPAVHSALLDLVSSPLAIAATAQSHARGEGTIIPIALSPLHSAMAVHAEELHRLRGAHLYAVDSEMTAQAIAAGTQLTDWSLEPTDLPCEQGFVIYDTPIGRTDTLEGAIPIVACSWGPSPGCAPSQGAVWLTFWSSPSPDMPAFAALRDVGPPSMLLWENEALVPWSAGPPEIPAESYHVLKADDITGIIANDRTLPWIRTIIATWLLVQQPTIVEIAEQHASRPDRRRAQRAGQILAPVRVVSIHRTIYSSPRPPTSSGRVVGVRFPVEGFWRKQPYGRGRELRRRQWIAAHWRGPRDAPVRERPKVHRVDSGSPLSP